ncbi:MAG TPA: phasin family protein [Stellaceae bacterium]|jgi:hypothetical protein
MAKVSPDIRANIAPPPARSHVDVTESDRDASATAVISNPAVNAGLEAIGLEVAQYVRTAFESAGETARGMLGVRTLEDVLRLQTDFAKRSLDSFIEHGAKLSELGCSLVGASAETWGMRARS